MDKVMSKGIIMEREGVLMLREFEIEPPGEGQVRIRIENCNICTSDWQTWNGSRKGSGRKLPFAPGHEAAGIIESVGPSVTEYQVGDHVAIGYTGCGYCTTCRNGDTGMCPNVKSIIRENITGGFGMSQYVVVNLRQVFKMNPQLPFVEACYLEPLATAVHGMRRLRINPLDNLLVIGAGNLGLVNAQLARIFGARVMISEINPQRIELCKALGFSTVNPKEEDIKEVVRHFCGGLMDGVILAVGNTEAVEQALQIIKRAGKILFFAAGYPVPELHLNANEIHYGKYELIGTVAANARDYELSCSLLSRGLIKTEQLISHQMPLYDYENAFRLAATPGNYRVSLKMWA